MDRNGRAGRKMLSERKRALVSVLILGVALLLSACAGRIAEEKGWSAPVVEDGILFVGARSGQYLAFDVHTLALGDRIKLDDEQTVARWRFPRERDETLRAPYGQALLEGGNAYLVVNREEGRRQESAELFAVDARDGRQAWADPARINAHVFGSPVLHGARVYLADEEGYLHSFELEDGRRARAPFRVSSERFWSSPIVADGALYIGSMDKRLYAVDPDTLREAWHFEAGGAFASTPLFRDGVIYIGAFDRKFYAIDTVTRQKKWEFEGNGWFWNDAVATRDGSLVLVGSLGGFFYALNTADGELEWEVETESPIRAAPVIVGDRVYVTSENGSILVLDMETGQERRKLVLDEKALATPAWANDTLYVHDLDQRLQVREALRR